MYGGTPIGLYIGLYGDGAYGTGMPFGSKAAAGPGMGMPYASYAPYGTGEGESTSGAAADAGDGGTNGFAVALSVNDSAFSFKADLAAGGGVDSGDGAASSSSSSSSSVFAGHAHARFQAS